MKQFVFSTTQTFYKKMPLLIIKWTKPGISNQGIILTKSGVIAETNKYPKNLSVLSLSLICLLHNKISVSKVIYSVDKGIVLEICVIQKGTRVCGITGSASARRWGGYGFNSRPKPRQS